MKPLKLLALGTTPAHSSALFQILLSLSFLCWNTSTNASAFLQVPERSVLSLGDGLNTTNMESFASCVSGTRMKNQQIQTEYFIDRPLTASALIKSLHSNGRLNVKDLSGLATDQIHRDFYTSKRRTLYYLVKVISAETWLENPAIDARRLQMGACGDSWIDRAQTGGYVLLRVHLDFLSENDADKVAQYGKFDSLGIQELERFLRGITVDLNDGVQLTLEMEQVGGDPIKLIQLFGTSDSKVSCRYPSLEPCLQLALSVRDYMISPEQFVSQFLKQDNAPLRLISLRNYQTSDSVVENLFHLRDHLTDLSSALSAAIHRLDEQLERAGESSDARYQSDLRTRLARDLESVLGKRRNCFIDSTSCKGSALVHPSRSKIVAPDHFLDYCRSRYKPASLNILIDALHYKFGSLSCLDLNESLRHTVELNLSSLGLDDLRYLAGLHALEILDLSGNQIKGLGTLPFLPRLFFLNLSRNRLTSLKGLQQFPGLKRLNLDQNQLTTFDIPLADFKLQGLRTTGNPLKDPEALRQATSHIVAAYITNQDVCQFFGEYALSQGLIKEEDLSLYQSIDFAPRFKDNGRKNAIAEWVHCIAAVDSYREQFPALEVSFRGRRAEYFTDRAGLELIGK
jgi:hypothetical protein